MGPINTSINNFIGPTSGLSYEPKAATANGSGGPSFLQVLSDLKDTFEQQTSKLALINLPDDKGTQVFTANPSKTSTVV